MNTNQNYYVINPVSKILVTFNDKESLNNYLSNDPHKFSENMDFKRKIIDANQVIDQKKLGYKLIQQNKKFDEAAANSRIRIDQYIKDKSYIQFIPDGDKNTLGVVVEFKHKEDRNQFIKESSIKQRKILYKKDRIDKEKIIIAYKNGNVMQAKAGYNKSMAEQTYLQVNTIIKNWNKLNPNFNSFIMVANKLEDGRLKSPNIIRTNKKIQYSLIKKLNKEAEKTNAEEKIIAKSIRPFSSITIVQVAMNIQNDLYKSNQKTAENQITYQKDMRKVQIENDLFIASKKQQNKQNQSQDLNQKQKMQR